MSSPFIIPLSGFAMVVILVAIVHLVRIRDMEIEAHQRIHLEEMEHQCKMRDLDLELEQAKKGAVNGAQGGRTTTGYELPTN